mgnify:CR=1 FL=1
MTGCPAAASKSTACSADAARADAGFVLISVLWVVLFLALAAAAFTISVRSHVQETSAEAASADARALADAGTQLALHDLVNARISRGWQRRFPTDGRAYTCTIGAARVTVAVEDEAGKIDLNTASDLLLRRLLVGTGLAAVEAERRAAAIIDYRDADSVRREAGAEAEEYFQAGRRNGPKNAPLDSPLELAQVLGIDTALMARLRPFVTVHSGLQSIDPSKAAPALLAMLGAEASLGTSARLPADIRATSSPQRVFLVRAQATGERGATFAREMVVRVAPSRSRHFAVLAWRQADAIPGTDSTDLGPC